MAKARVQICDWCRQEIRDPKIPGHATIPEGWSDFGMLTVYRHSDEMKRENRDLMGQEICKSCTDQIKLLIEQIKLHKG